MTNPIPQPVALPTDGANAITMGAALIRQVEGCTLKPTPDIPPHWQIGYGCNYLADGSAVTPDTPPLESANAANALLLAKLPPLAADVDEAVTVWLPVCARAALYSFSWNLGLGAFKGSTMLKLINAGDMAGAADQFPSWVYAGGKKLSALVNRRRLERAVFLGLTPV